MPDTEGAPGRRVRGCEVSAGRGGGWVQWQLWGDVCGMQPLARPSERSYRPRPIPGLSPSRSHWRVPPSATRAYRVGAGGSEGLQLFASTFHLL